MHPTDGATVHFSAALRRSWNASGLQRGKYLFDMSLRVSQRWQYLYYLDYSFRKTRERNSLKIRLRFGVSQTFFALEHFANAEHSLGNFDRKLSCFGWANENRIKTAGVKVNSHVLVSMYVLLIHVMQCLRKLGKKELESQASKSAHMYLF